MEPESFLDYFLVQVPAMSVTDIVIHVVAMLGAILITYGVFLEAEKRQDAVFMLGGLALLVYALWLPSPVFIVAMLLFTFANAWEFMQILIGKHRHLFTDPDSPRTKSRKSN